MRKQSQFTETVTISLREYENLKKERNVWDLVNDKSDVLLVQHSCRGNLAYVGKNKIVTFLVNELKASIESELYFRDKMHESNEQLKNLEEKLKNKKSRGFCFFCCKK